MIVFGLVTSLLGIRAKEIIRNLNKGVHLRPTTAKHRKGKHGSGHPTHRAALKTSVHKCHWHEKIQCNDKWGKSRSKITELHFNQVKKQRKKSEQKPLRALIFN